MRTFYGNQYVRVKRIASQIKSGFIKSIAIAGIITVGGWIMYGGIVYEKLTSKPKLVTAQVKVEVPVEINAPVMDRIMSCESKGQQFKNGQVNIHVNNDGTVDMGIMQINSVNFALATKMGYDLAKESDNKAFGLWLFKNRGTEPWYSSKACWNH